MRNFTHHNPTEIVFGKGTISKLAELIPPGRTIMLTYGGGSIMRNGVYEQVMQALTGQRVVPFGGIEPNPCYETLMQAVAQARAEGVDFLLAVGGGSVVDGTKFIAAALRYEGADPWDILANGARVQSAVPLAAVLTLPATGSEMNSGAVISRQSTREKLAFGSRYTYPVFSILDPETTYSLPPRQVANGIVDAFVHVDEQYLTYDVGSPLQDRQAEAVLSTLVELAPRVMATPEDYALRADLMWCATQALNGLIACGVVEDWATHGIGHELTAFFGLDHGQSLAVVHPALLRHELPRKLGKLAQFGRRIWGIQGLDDQQTAEEAIARTEAFFRSVGTPTRLSDYNISLAACQPIVERLARRGSKLGEHEAIDAQAVGEILSLCA
jgi:NADP-dependent alcohol dehydrogenase